MNGVHGSYMDISKMLYRMFIFLYSIKMLPNFMGTKKSRSLNIR